MTQPAPDLVRVRTAAKLVDVSPRTIRDWIDRGLVTAYQPAGPGHAIRIDRGELLRHRDAGAPDATTSRNVENDAALGRSEEK